MTQNFDIYTLLLIISFLSYIFYRDDNTKAAKTQYVLNHPNIKETFTMFNKEELQNHSSYTYDETYHTPIIPQEEYITHIIPEEEYTLVKDFSQSLYNKNSNIRCRNLDSIKDPNESKGTNVVHHISGIDPNESNSLIGAPINI